MVPVMLLSACRWQRHRQTALGAMLVLMAVASMLGPDTQPILGLPFNFTCDTAWEWLLFQSTVQACASMPVMLRVSSRLRSASTSHQHAPPPRSLVLTSSLFMLHNAQKRLCLPSQCSLVLQINMISVAASQAAVWASLLIAAPANVSAKPVQLDLPGDQLHSLGSSLMPILAVLAVPTLAFCLKQGW